MSNPTAETPRTAQAHLSLAMTAKLKTVAYRKAEAIRQRRLRYQHVTEESKSLSTLITHSYTMPTFSTLPVVMLLAVYLNVFYESLGCNLAYLSFFIALARGLDVVSDPLMSFISDSSRLKKGFWLSGRRRPFMLTGCFFYALFLFCLLSPPELSPPALSIYFGAFYILFFLASTFTCIPYDALGPELTDDYEDRSHLFFVSGLYVGLERAKRARRRQKNEERTRRLSLLRRFTSLYSLSVTVLSHFVV